MFSYSDFIFQVPTTKTAAKKNGRHSLTQKTEDEPRVPECDADDDDVADEPVQPRRYRSTASQASAYERARRVHPLA